MGFAHQQVADVPRLFRGADGDVAQFLGLAPKGLGHGLGAEVGILRRLPQLDDAVTDLGVDGARPGRRQFRGPGEGLGLALEALGEGSGPGFGPIGGKYQPGQVPLQAHTVAMQGPASLEEGDDHPQQCQGSQHASRQTPDLVGQQGAQVGQQNTFGDKSPHAVEPGRRHRDSRQGGKSVPQIEWWRPGFRAQPVCVSDGSGLAVVAEHQIEDTGVGIAVGGGSSAFQGLLQTAANGFRRLAVGAGLFAVHGDLPRQWRNHAQVWLIPIIAPIPGE